MWHIGLLYRSDDVSATESSAVVSSSCRTVDHCTVVSDDPVLPVRRHKSRHAAVPAAATNDSVTATAPDVAAAGVKLRQVHSDSEDPCCESVTPASECSLSARRSSSLRHLAGHVTAMTSLHCSDDVAVTSAGAVTGRVDGPAVRPTCDHQPDELHERDFTTSALYTEPREIVRRRQDETTTTATTTRRRSLCDTTRSSLQTNGQCPSIGDTSSQKHAASCVDTANSHDYEAIEYSRSQPTTTSRNESYPQQSRTKDQVYTKK